MATIERKANRQCYLSLCFLLLFIGTVMFLLYNNQQIFSGRRMKNPDAYLLDIEIMNGTDSHSFGLRADDILQIHCKTVKGSLNMEIQSTDGTVIYSGNGREVTDFTIRIPKNGTYTVRIEAQLAKGFIHIMRKVGA